VAGAGGQALADIKRLPVLRQPVELLLLLLLLLLLAA